MLNYFVILLHLFYLLDYVTQTEFFRLMIAKKTPHGEIYSLHHFLNLGNICKWRFARLSDINVQITLYICYEFDKLEKVCLHIEISF